MAETLEKTSTQAEKTPIKAINDFLTDLGQREGVIEGVLSDRTGLPMGATMSPNSESLAAWSSLVMNTAQEMSNMFLETQGMKKEEIRFIQINQRGGAKTLLIPHEEIILSVTIHGVIKSKLGGKRRTARKLSVEKFKKAKEMEGKNTKG
ncbi:MAG: hypothetical protein ACFFDT_16325 [Candidatus Hodarchaeota archaeon]